MYKGFYRNTTLERTYDDDECLGRDSYEALNIIVKAYDASQNGDYSYDMMGATALIRMLIDNH